MNRTQLDDIQAKTGIRLIVPFGLGLRIGDVVRVEHDGAVQLQGAAATLLGVPAPGVDDIAFRAAGRAGALFPELPSATAGIDVSFESATGGLLACTGRRLSSLVDGDRYRQAVLDAHGRGVWQRDWALVTEVAVVDRMVLLAAGGRDTAVALALAGTVDPAAPLAAQLSAATSIAAARAEFTQCLTTEPGPVGFRAIRVREHWWQRSEVGPLGVLPSTEPARAVPYADFWQDADGP